MLANQARAIFERDLSNSHLIETAARRKARTFWDKVKECWTYFILVRLDPYMARDLCAMASNSNSPEL